MATKKLKWVFWGFFIIAVWAFMSQQLFAQAQQTAVPVDQEPYHRTVFQNQNVRIYDVLIPPGVQTLFHVHSFDSFAIVVNGGKLKGERPGGTSEEFPMNTGNVAYNTPVTHRTENVGTTPIRMIACEVLSSSSSPGVPAVLKDVPGHQWVFENDRVTVYRVSIDPDQSTGIRSRMLPWLRVSITQTTISAQGPGKTPETIETKPGDYRWYGNPTTDSIKNIGSTKYEAIEIEWK